MYSQFTLETILFNIHIFSLYRQTISIPSVIMGNDNDNELFLKYIEIVIILTIHCQGNYNITKCR